MTYVVSGDSNNVESRLVWKAFTVRGLAEIIQHLLIPLGVLSSAKLLGLGEARKSFLQRDNPAAAQVFTNAKGFRVLNYP